MPQGITIFCGSAPGADPLYVEQAAELGREIARAAGRGTLTLHTGAARGVVVVKVTAADGSRTVRKIIL